MAAYAKLAGVEIGDGFPVRIMGAINVSPESFFAGSVAATEEALRTRADEMVRQGADMLDIGAMSTAPYLPTRICEEEEIRRLASALRVLRRSSPVPISADTSRSRVARAALDEGASVINDVTGLRGDPGMAAVAARAQGVILMAAEAAPGLAGPIQAAADLLNASCRIAEHAGIPRQGIVLDPGIGFFRQAALPWWEWDCEILRRLSDLRRLLEHPILIGLSRKSFLGKLVDRADPADRLAGSVAATAIGVLNGAQMFRTHDVAPTRDAIRIAEALRPA
jgi:dihydropteroate synthase